MDIHSKRLRALARAAKRSGVGPMLVISTGSVQDMACGIVEPPAAGDRDAAEVALRRLFQADAEVGCLCKRQPADAKLCMVAYEYPYNLCGIDQTSSGLNCPKPKPW